MGAENNKVPLGGESPHIVKLAASFCKNGKVAIENPISSWEEMEKELEALSENELEVLLALVTDMKEKGWGNLEAASSNGN